MMSREADTYRVLLESSRPVHQRHFEVERKQQKKLTIKEANGEQLKRRVVFRAPSLCCRACSCSCSPPHGATPTPNAVCWLLGKH